MASPFKQRKGKTPPKKDPPKKDPPKKDPPKKGPELKNRARPTAATHGRNTVYSEGTAYTYGADMKKSESGLSHKGDPLVTMYAKAEKSAVGSRVRAGSAKKNALSIAKAQDIESLYDHSPFTKKDKY